jgi:hypothetical protein
MAFGFQEGNKTIPATAARVGPKTQTDLLTLGIFVALMPRREAIKRFDPPAKSRVFSTPKTGMRMKPAASDPMMQPSVLKA